MELLSRAPNNAGPNTPTVAAGTMVGLSPAIGPKEAGASSPPTGVPVIVTLPTAGASPGRHAPKPYLVTMPGRILGVCMIIVVPGVAEDVAES